MNKIKLSFAALSICAISFSAFAEEVEKEAVNTFVGENQFSSTQITDDVKITFDENDMIISYKDDENAPQEVKVPLNKLTKIEFGAYDQSKATSNDPAAKAYFNVNADDVVSVSCSDGIRSIRVVGLNGAPIVAEVFANTPNEAEISLATAPNGVAVIVVETTKSIVSQKVTIKR